jgi:hypothetical protein
MTGREAYEADRAKRPLYHDHTPRPSWDDLSAIAKRSWVQPEKPIVYPTEPTPIGNQYVIPGCEKDKTRGPVQPDLF